MKSTLEKGKTTKLVKPSNSVKKRPSTRKREELNIVPVVGESYLSAGAGVATVQRVGDSPAFRKTFQLDFAGVAKES